MHVVKTVILTGLSGSGKSTAMHALEDLGFFCIDNLPPVLLPKFIELCQASSGEISKVGLVMDVRERTFLKECSVIFEELKRKGQKIEILFLESSDEVLVRRFKETRRHHPLAGRGSLIEGIKRERLELSDLRASANEILDTSNLTVHQLREVITHHFSRIPERRRMVITLTSFGYKYGIPYDADLVMDVRFLPNPFFVNELKDFTGNDERVYGYVMNNKLAETFQKKFLALIRFLIPYYEKEGKAYLTIGVGCTGGQHRSVTVVNSLEKLLSRTRYPVRVIHRDLGKT